MIKVCADCSNINIEQLMESVGEVKVEIGCVGDCAAYETEAYGLVNGELVVEASSDEWIKKISNMI